MKPLTGLHDHKVFRAPRNGKIFQRDRIVTRGARELERELEQKRRFASDASHELRGPLAGLRAELEEARLHPGQTDLGDLLARALRNLDRLDAILTELMLVSKGEACLPDDLQRVNLATLARAEVAGRADRVTARLRVEPGVVVYAVPGRIARVLHNLLDNAQRHAERDVLVQVRRNGDLAELTVEDDGAGIAEADRERIFQRFTRLDPVRGCDRARRGAGLGLAVSRDIARAHAGTLLAGDSGLGGACFTLRLPLARPFGAATGPRPAGTRP